MSMFDTKFDYVSKFKICIIGSILMIASFVVLSFTKGLNYGVDFRGGAEIQLKFTNDFSLADLRSTLEAAQLPVSSVQSIGDTKNEYLIKIQGGANNLNELSQGISTKLGEKVGKENVTILKTDIVGPKAGADLRNSSIKAMLWALISIMIYVALRFDYKYAPGAIIALFHDVSFMIGIFIITQKEFSLQIVAALLAVIGYSVNDTVVIYDRVREIEQANPGMPMSKIINVALNETMSRTILTSLTVFIVCLVMFFMGGGVIHDFFFALTVGVISGTYSTVFIAAPITIWFDRLLSKKQSAVKTLA